MNDEETRQMIKEDPYNLNRAPYPNTNITRDLQYSAPRYWAMYRPCFFELYCNATNEFDCQNFQPERTFQINLYGLGSATLSIRLTRFCS